MSWPGTVVHRCSLIYGASIAGGWTQNLPLRLWVGQVRPVICTRGDLERWMQGPNPIQTPGKLGGLRVRGLHSSKDLPPACLSLRYPTGNPTKPTPFRFPVTILLSSQDSKPPDHFSDHHVFHPPPPTTILTITTTRPPCC